MAFKLGMTVDLCMAYMLMLVSMTLTLIQGHNGSTEENNIKAMAFKLRMTVDLYMTYAHVRFDDLDFENVCKARPSCSFSLCCELQLFDFGYVRSLFLCSLLCWSCIICNRFSFLFSCLISCVSPLLYSLRALLYFNLCTN